MMTPVAARPTRTSYIDRFYLTGVTTAVVSAPTAASSVQRLLRPACLPGYPRTRDPGRCNYRRACLARRPLYRTSSTTGVRSDTGRGRKSPGPFRRPARSFCIFGTAAAPPRSPSPPPAAASAADSRRRRRQPRLRRGATGRQPRTPLGSAGRSWGAARSPPRGRHGRRHGRGSLGSGTASCARRHRRPPCSAAARREPGGRRRLREGRGQGGAERAPSRALKGGAQGGARGGTEHLSDCRVGEGGVTACSEAGRLEALRVPRLDPLDVAVDARPVRTSLQPNHSRPPLHRQLREGLFAH